LNSKAHGLKLAVINNEFAAALDIGTKHELAPAASDNASESLRTRILAGTYIA
jgi:hypothetical protein